MEKSLEHPVIHTAVQVVLAKKYILWYFSVQRRKDMLGEKVCLPHRFLKFPEIPLRDVPVSAPAAAWQ